MTVHYAKLGDTAGDIYSTLLDDAGAPVDLTGSTVAFHGKPRSSTNPHITGTASIVNAALGQVKYDLATGDTAVVEKYEIEWVVTYPSTEVQTFPNFGFDTLIVSANALV